MNTYTTRSKALEIHPEFAVCLNEDLSNVKCNCLHFYKGKE
jgi:hypothetical protein